jgi:hypothetical protein
MNVSENIKRGVDNILSDLVPKMSEREMMRERRDEDTRESYTPTRQDCEVYLQGSNPNDIDSYPDEIFEDEPIREFAGGNISEDVKTLYYNDLPINMS